MFVGIEDGVEAKHTEGISEVAQKVAADDDSQAHKVSTVSVSEVHPQETVTELVPGIMDIHGFTRVGYWQNVIVRTGGSSRSGFAAKTLKMADLQPLRVGRRSQPTIVDQARTQTGGRCCDRRHSKPSDCDPQGTRVGQSWGRHQED